MNWIVSHDSYSAMYAISHINCHFYEFVNKKVLFCNSISQHTSPYNKSFLYNNRNLFDTHPGSSYTLDKPSQVLPSGTNLEKTV